MIDALAIPGLAILVVAFMAYVWFAWLKDKKGRALAIREDQGEETTGLRD